MEGLAVRFQAQHGALLPTPYQQRSGGQTYGVGCGIRPMPLGCPPAATGSPHARFRLPLPACAGTSGVHLLLSRALVVRAPTLATAAVVAAVLELVAALVVSTPKTLVTTKWAFYAFNRWGERSACTPIASKHGRGWVGAVGWSRARPPTRPPARRPVAAPTSPPPQHLGHAGRQPGGQDAGVLTPAGRVAPVVGLRAVPHGEGGGARGATGRAGLRGLAPAFACRDVCDFAESGGAKAGAIALVASGADPVVGDEAA